MSNMTSYKRKRIEKWCEEVALYLRNGTICRSVIGHVVEDAINCNSAVKSAPDVNENRENVPNNGQTVGNTSCQNPQGTGNTKEDHGLKKATQASDGFHNIKDINPGIGHVIGNGSGALPIMKFAYSHYHEQRRKIDRLVQGLPVLNANGLATMDRPSSKASTDEHVPIIFVNGEEPVRTSNPRSRSSSQPRHQHHHHHHHFSHAHIASGNHNNIHQLHAPHTARQMAAPFRSLGATARSGSCDPHIRRTSTGVNKLYDIKGGHHPNVAVNVDPGLATLTANDRVARSKTAPAPNRNVHRARQRILTRRGNRILDHTSQIPLQNCWAMAELTW